MGNSMPTIKCDTCKVKFERRPDKIRARNFCSMSCYHEHTDRKKVQCVCPTCKLTFLKKSYNIRVESKDTFCSKKCARSYRKGKMCPCANCQKKIYVAPHNTKRYSNHFCSRSCGASYYNNFQKIHQSRSKLEHFLEEQISDFFPKLRLITNDRDCLDGKEIDLYFPTIKLAIEINGPHHYKPIYGRDKLAITLQNDIFKRILCMSKGVDLVCIPYLDYLSDKNKARYLSRIFEIIESRL